MLKRFLLIAMLLTLAATVPVRASAKDEAEVRDFIARWNAAYTGLDAVALAALETPDFELVDRFGHWIKSEGSDFNLRLWAMTFKDIYRGKPGPARAIESIRFLAPGVAIVQARANHPDGVTLDDGTHIPPFWEINTYTLIKTVSGWRVALLNIHNQINFQDEGTGQHVPNASTRNGNRK
jgi:ketosteroid isomerase-like protein